MIAKTFVPKKGGKPFAIKPLVAQAPQRGEDAGF